MHSGLTGIEYALEKYLKIILDNGMEWCYNINNGLSCTNTRGDNMTNRHLDMAIGSAEAIKFLLSMTDGELNGYIALLGGVDPKRRTAIERLVVRAYALRA